MANERKDRVLERKKKENKDVGSPMPATVEFFRESTTLQKEFHCKLTTVSKIIEDYNLNEVDMVKVDVERSEVDVLLGIKPQHWAKIRQFVIEVEVCSFCFVQTQLTSDKRTIKTI